MKFLCLAYGDEAGWNTLSNDAKAEVLAADERIRQRGDFMTAVRPDVTTVTNWSGNLVRRDAPCQPGSLPLAGFSIIEADSIEEVVELVSNTPCARANGAIEIRPFWNLGESDAEEAD